LWKVIPSKARKALVPFSYVDYFGSRNALCGRVQSKGEIEAREKSLTELVDFFVYFLVDADILPTDSPNNTPRFLSSLAKEGP
jgi:hypothetical protein